MKKIKAFQVIFFLVCFVCAGQVGTRIALGQDDSDELDGQSPEPLPLLCCDDSYSTSNKITNERKIQVPDTSKVVHLWEEDQPDGTKASFFAIDSDEDAASPTDGRVRMANYTIRLRYATFDPLVDSPAPLVSELAATRNNQIFLVQFWTVPIEEYRQQIEALGGRILRYLPDHSLIVRAQSSAAGGIGQLPYVRWMGDFHPAYKLDQSIIKAYRSGANVVEGAQEGRGEFPTQYEYSIEVFERAGGGPVIEAPAEETDKGSFSPAPRTHTLPDSDDLGQQAVVKAAIEAMGGSVSVVTPGGFRMQATLTMEQLLQVAQMNEVHFIEPWGMGGADMNVVRDLGGANFVESTLGFTGQGVRAEVFDSEVRTTHTEFTSLVPTLHSTTAGDATIPHGTSVYSHMFARGASSTARGLLPDADVGYFYYYGESTMFGGTGDSRLQIANDLTGFNAVLQTSSVGSPLNTSYSDMSQEMDDVIFQTGVLHMQSQSNNATATNGSNARLSRPQAWAKNIVSVGAVNHYNTASRADDTWVGDGTGCTVSTTGTSVGPAEDGRIKPDLCFFYDCTWAAHNGYDPPEWPPTYSDTAYRQFGGTSGATPSVSGYMGLFHQMWHENTWDGSGMLTDGSGSVFSNRPKAMLAKAALVNTAFRYDWTPGTARTLPGSIDRYVQGWGMPDLENLYDLRDKTFYVNESNLLRNGHNKTHIIKVPSGESDLNVTLVYMDPAGTTSSSLHRINDLSLKVTSPSGVEYWGNNGLTDDNTSTNGGSSNTVDTVENVFIPNPETGRWFVQVFADAVVQDSHVETTTTDADYALWATGGTESGSLKTTYQAGNGQDGAMFDITAHETVTITGFDLAHSSATTETFEVYYTPGGYAGNETNAAAWTLLGSRTVTPNGSGVATFVDIGGLSIKPEETYGIYITEIGTSGGYMQYTNGSETFDNGEIMIETGVGSAYPFAGTINPRTWNGTVYYSIRPLDETGPFAFSIQSNGDNRLYRIDLSTGYAKPLGDPMVFGDAEGMAIGSKGTVYAIGGSVEELWNVGSPPGVLIGSTGSRSGNDAGLDYYDGMLFNVNSGQLYRINPATGSASPVGSNTTYLDGLAIRGDGAAFATDWVFTDSLYQVNLSNGTATLVGSLGLGSVSAQSGLSFLGDTLYAITSNGEIYTIDTSTGSATFVANVTLDGFTIAGGWEGLAIPPCSGATPTELEPFNYTFSGTSITRGYWFTAPTDFLITGLRVPDEAGAGIQNVEVVRFDSPPPNYSDYSSRTLDDAGQLDFIDANTNQFVSLFRRVDVSGNSIIHTAIPVREGDVIGILGATGTTTMRNSYATSNEYTTEIFNEPTILKRLGMQYNLNTTQARNIWTENAGAFSRVEMYYIKAPDIVLNADTVATGSTLHTTPLSTPFGTISATGTVVIRSTADPELALAGSSGNVFNILANSTAEMTFDFDIESVTFVYGGNIGSILVEARDASGAMVDSFSQNNTYSGQPAGPQTLSGAGIRSLYWEDPGNNFAALDNLCILATQPINLCECDLNHDGKCNILDYQVFIQDWGRTNCGTPPGSGNPPNDCECDLNLDGKCNILDYQIFIQDWGRTDCP